MAKFCGKCGNALEEGAKFCSECGNKVYEQQSETPKAPEEKKPEPKIIPQPQSQPQPQPQPKAEAVKPAAPIPPRPVKAQPQVQNAIPQPKVTPQPADKANKVAGMGAFFGLMILFALPIIGFIAAIVFSFAPKNKNIKNFARATLVWMVVGIVIIGLLLALFSIMAASVLNFIQNLIDEYTYEYDIDSNVTYDGGTTDRNANTVYGDIYDAASEAEKIIIDFDYSIVEEYVTAIQ